jgi:leucine dehydrogenase
MKITIPISVGELLDKISILEIKSQHTESSYVTQELQDLIRVAKEYNCKVTDVNAIYDVPCDIYAPCALGSTLNDQTIPTLRCRIVAGGANNQLADVSLHAKMLADRGIIYAQDFVINAGGLINVYSEIKGYTRDEAMERTTALYDQTLKILEMAEQLGVTTHEAAVRTARTRIDSRAVLATA